MQPVPAEPVLSRPQRRQIYVNLPVRDLRRSRRFYEGIGFSFQPQFTDDRAACVVVADRIFVLLVEEGFFRSFLPERAVCDARQSTEVLVCISCASQLEVDETVAKAAARGGKAVRQPKDLGFMYQHGFEDPDGHIWELVYMRNTPSE